MLHFEPDLRKFHDLAGRVNAIPVYASLLSDQLTPVSAFDRLASDAEHAFLLESVVGGEKIARYSFLGMDPIAMIESCEGNTHTRMADGSEQSSAGDPLKELERLLNRFRAAHPPQLPRFLGGAVGYAGYDVVRQYESLCTPPPDDRKLPDMQFGIYDQMVIFDHVKKLVHIVAHAHVGDGTDPDESYGVACDRIRAIADRLGEPRTDPVRPLIPAVPDDVEFQSNFTAEQFEEVVEQCKAYIRAGDIFQVVVSQRLSATTKATPFDVYRALRVINPSPFMFFVKSPATTLVGASPEILCRLEDRTVSTRPLAGTRVRGKTEAEDLGLEKELLADPKERAEHVMLVDLGRNDLGRICEPGSVKIDDLMSIERYSHVMHICSSVSGKLADGMSAFDAIRSVLPVGTVSGAPKIRAMEIIDEFERSRRGPYAGAVGYVDFSGNMDTCIALRTLVVTPAANGEYRVDAQVGAGIVADSEPEKEFKETLNKAQSMLSALNIANAWESGKAADPS